MVFVLSGELDLDTIGSCKTHFLTRMIIFLRKLKILKLFDIVMPATLLIHEIYFRIYADPAIN